MNFFKKLTAKPYLQITAIILAVGFCIYYYHIDPLDISLDSPAHKLKNYVKPNEVVVVSFWATWCPYCRNEINALKQFKQQHPKITVLGLQLDGGSSGDILQNAGYPNLDASLHGVQIMELFGNYTEALPFTIILENHSSKTLLGETSPEELEQDISAIQMKSDKL